MAPLLYTKYIDPDSEEGLGFDITQVDPQVRTNHSLQLVS